MMKDMKDTVAVDVAVRAETKMVVSVQTAEALLPEAVRVQVLQADVLNGQTNLDTVK